MQLRSIVLSQRFQTLATGKLLPRLGTAGLSGSAVTCIITLAIDVGIQAMME